MADRRHVFVSHHHADDAHVDKFSKLLAGKNYEIRNSSIRAKPANQDRLDRGLVSDNTIKRLLRMKMRWASTVVVLIGKKTHQRRWVDWEIQLAKQLGKKIIGVYTYGADKGDLPEALDDYATTIRNWNAASVIDAIEGNGDNLFKSPEGDLRAPVHTPTTSRC